MRHNKTAKRYDWVRWHGLKWLSCILIATGCADPAKPLETRNRTADEFMSANMQLGEFPSTLRESTGIDTASFTWMDEADKWIKAKIKPAYSLATLQQDIEDLKVNYYEGYQFSTVDQLTPWDPGDLPGQPHDWPNLPEKTPEWWQPPTSIGDCVAYLFARQVRADPKGYGDVATGLYVLYSEQEQTLWLWRWNMQHVKLRE